jgi:RNA recognition motif-containing protein
LNKKLYVGNLPFTTTDTELKSMFEAYGAVDRVSIITDRETGRPRGFAFVEMGDSSSADSAIKGLDGREVGGRALRVNEATSTGGGGGGGGGGGRGRY